MQNKIQAIQTMVDCINQQKSTFPDLVTESIIGYGFNEVEQSIAEGINESDVDSHIMSLMHICDVIDEEVVMPISFYSAMDEIQNYLAS
ncbi:hypothetical protein LMH73_015960 [Vibrio splendidus]|nr:hypothetical protein [Vibrio splendidus]MCC4880440.1 hypothetical protein [Vibrio splendidus]